MKLLTAVFALSLNTIAAGQTLHVYGPGGPIAPMKECAELYTNQTHIQVEVMAGPEDKWITSAQSNADIIYGGAEYMLTQFGQKHPGFLQEGSRSELYRRAIGILVRKNNPKHIHDLADLTKPGVRILNVDGAGQLGVWEDLAGRKNLIGPLQEHIAVSSVNSAEGIKQWDENPSLDAWITYDSWQKRLPTTTDLVRFPREMTLYRGTPVAIASRSEQKTEAAAFIKFLHSEPAHAIFLRWGWR